MDIDVNDVILQAGIFFLQSIQGTGTLLLGLKEPGGKEEEGPEQP
jgi:hypothetical protein